ncbi:MAG: membrane protein insertion efficiency factor YidD [Bdellovibrionales bacterium]|nr:membrane protein insertion efficiency factor YidD [Bdellovibrionales bacterium]
MNKVIIALTYIYKYTFSVFLGGNCRFYPSCSNYCIEAYNTHGFIKATLLTLNRLKKCHPLGEGGYDPVPSSGKTSRSCCKQKAVS